MLRQKLLLIFLSISVLGFSLPYKFHSSIKWNGIEKVNSRGYMVERLAFDDAHYNDNNELPVYINKLLIHTSKAKLEVSLQNQIFVPLSLAEAKIISAAGLNNTSINVNARIVISRKQPMAHVELIPIRWNVNKHMFEKLTDFDIVVDVIDDYKASNNNKEYTSTSALATGQWFKIKLDKSGIYKITYNDLSSMGFDMSVTPSHISVFGNGGGLLPEKNDEFRYDDLVEDPIQVVGGDDGSLDQGDYILFYGEGPVTWKYNPISLGFNHQTNYYKDFSYYFITALDQSGKRIQNTDVPTGSADVIINDFNDYAVHDIDERNLDGVGRTWFGEIYDYNTTYEFDFDFPNIKKQSGTGYFRGYFASRAFSVSSFNFFINNQLEETTTIQPLPSGERYQYAKSASPSFNFTPVSDNVAVKTTYQRNSNSSVGFLDFIEVNVQRNLVFTGDQMMFRKVLEQGNNVASYNLSQANQDITVWDVSSAVNPKKVVTQLDGSGLAFKYDATSFHEFIAFTQNNFLTAQFVEEVENQNLHSYNNIDFLIVTYPEFLAEADSLANFHRVREGMSVLVTTVDKIYNEFSSGGQDITAIRDFAKRLYDNSDPGKELKYLLLFGDASYDYKDITPDNTNFVPCWESVYSLNVVTSIASDDYFGFLDDGEGIEFQNDLVDIGIGRFVVKNVEEAKSAVDKTIHYSVNTTQTMASWRNMVTFIADDGDNNLHLKHAEALSDIFNSDFPVYNINKIYVDAYHQISSPSGQTAPDVNRSINQRIEKGTLIFNYSGHGGEIGLGHEQIVQIADINSWKNYDKLTVFITATCEFTRYDDPKRVSAGELVFLNNEGGAISLFTTTRATYAGSNLAINKAIYNNNMFEKIDGEYPRFGDIIRKSKLIGNSNDMKFLLVGDPACRMAYPTEVAKTVSINSHISTENDSDTISALQLVKVKGIVTNRNGDKLTDFNGDLFSSIYDKESKIVTYGDENPPYTFYVRNNVIFNGKSSIANGDFSFEFMVPKDISYNYGFGKISYYLRDFDNVDGNGYDNHIIVGGLYDSANVDTQGPDIKLYLDDTTFKSGDVTNQNPVLLAFVSDSSGINTTGSGIGHDIITVVNEDKELTYVLNDYYQADKNRYNKGVINYPISDLPDGEHSLTLKVWDVYNNSSTAEINFLVISADQLVVENLMNYPNPFVNKTNFVFDHNQSGNKIDVLIDIYSLDGELVKSIAVKLNPEGHRSEPITWDGSTNSGGKIGAGFYVYNVTVRNQNGSVGYDQSKLIYIR